MKNEFTSKLEMMANSLERECQMCSGKFTVPVVPDITILCTSCKAKSEKWVGGSKS